MVKAFALIGFAAAHAQPGVNSSDSVNVDWTSHRLDGTDGGSLRVYTPSSATAESPKPLVIFYHGTMAGGLAIVTYDALLKKIAENGFLVVAPTSCLFGCSETSNDIGMCNAEAMSNSNPSTGGDSWNTWFTVGMRAIDYAKQNSDLASIIDWGRGIGSVGHSMGGQAAAALCQGSCSQDLDVRAAVSVFATDGFQSAPDADGNRQVLPVTCPLAALSGSLDGDNGDCNGSVDPTAPCQNPFGCPDCVQGTKTRGIFDAGTTAKLWRSKPGQSHTSPTAVFPNDNTNDIGQRTADWLNLFLGGPGTPDMSLCGADYDPSTPYDKCELVGGSVTDHVVV